MLNFKSYYILKLDPKSIINWLIFVVSNQQILAAYHFCDANPIQDKLEILDKKFRTRIAIQPTAFVHGEKVTEGVELGCYGYIKGDAPHRVFYSYDAKDYRLINIRNMKFLVHPSKGSMR